MSQKISCIQKYIYFFYFSVGSGSMWGLSIYNLDLLAFSLKVAKTFILWMCVTSVQVSVNFKFYWNFSSLATSQKHSLKSQGLLAFLVFWNSGGNKKDITVFFKN